MVNAHVLMELMDFNVVTNASPVISTSLLKQDVQVLLIYYSFSTSNDCTFLLLAECECSTKVLTQSCNDNGHCNCMEGATGMKCDQCSSGYIGI